MIREMTQAAISALQQEGITRVCLNVMETNEYGKSFWLKRGNQKGRRKAVDKSSLKKCYEHAFILG